MEYLVEEKISRIVNEVRRIVDIDTVILSSKSALRYIFSELWPPTVLDQLGIPIQLLVLDLQSSVMRVYTSAMEYLGVKELVSNAVKSWSIDVVPVSRYLNEVFGIKTVSDLKEHLRKELENSRIVALDELQQNVGQAVRDKDVLVIKRIIEAIRRRKSSEEIERIRRCVEICTVSLKRLVESLNTGLNELSIANMLERYLFEAGAQGVAFATIVAIGKSARDPHHVPRRSIRLERGAPVLIDFGAYVDGYVCDITRMVLPRELDPMYSRVRELCKVIDGAINEALEIIHVGERYSRVDEEARRALNDYTKYFVHGLGHGIGVEVHERPIISPRSEDRVEVGDVVTIEPGIYMEHVGARIEEDVVVGTKGIEVISAGLPEFLRCSFVPKRIKLFSPMIGDEEISRVIEVLKSGWLAHGPVVEEFERRFAEYVGVNYAAAVSNGTVALMLLLKAYGIGPGDKVLVPDYTFIATATSVLMVGARPVLVDIEEDTFNIDPEDLLRKIDSSCRAIIAVHLFGHPANMKVLRDIAQDHGLILIEDAAQAHGAEAYGKKVGSLGDSAAFSFYATKNMTTGGEGGIVVSDDRKVIEKVKLLRNHGQVGKYIHAYLGGNYRMTSMQAAIGIAQLEKLDKMNEARRRNAFRYRELLSGVKAIKLPTEMPWARHVYHLYAVKLPENIRDCVKECMLRNSIEVAVHYPIPIHEQPLFRKLGIDHECPTSSKVSREELSIPVHPGLSSEDIDYIASTLRRCVDACLEQS